MTQSYTDLIAIGGELFAQRRYDECVVRLTEAYTEVERRQNWLLCAELSERLGLARAALGNYERASSLFRRAKTMRQRVPPNDQTEQRLAALERYAAAASEDEISDEEVESIRLRCAKLCLAKQYDQADSVAAHELTYAVKAYGERAWHVAGLKMVQVMCKVQRMTATSDGTAERGIDATLSLKEEARALCQEVIDIVDEHDYRAFWLGEKAREMLAELNTLEESEALDFAGAEGKDWEPESEEPAEKRPASESSARLRCWGEAFPELDVSANRQKEDATYVIPVEQLFVRHEYRQCFPLLSDLLIRARQRNDRVLAGLTLVMAGRCNRALGQYDEAVKAFAAAKGWLEQVPQFGQLLAERVDQMVDDCQNDALTASKLDPLRAIVAELCRNGHYAEAADRCDIEWRRWQRGFGSEHWLAAALKLIQAECLIGRVRQARGSEKPSSDFDWLLLDAGRLLDEARVIVQSHGHDVYWLCSEDAQKVWTSLVEMN